MDYSLIILIVIAIVALVIVRKFMKYYKVPKIACVSLVTGGVKSGKSTFSVHLAIRTYKRIHRHWKFRAYFQKLLHRPITEEPLLYSNIPLACDYSPITLELLRRETRPRYGSVAYVNEANLVADQMLYKDDELNERLSLFNKLFGHETCGGYLVYDTQCVSDVHYAVKRSISNYFYIHHLEKRIPFFLVAKVREERYSEDGTVVNNYAEDTEDTLKTVLIPKRIWKMFDCYCFSTFTDKLPVSAKVLHGERGDLKVKELVSFRTFKTLYKEDLKLKKPLPTPIQKTVKNEVNKNA